MANETAYNDVDDLFNLTLYDKNISNFICFEKHNITF